MLDRMLTNELNDFTNALAAGNKALAMQQLSGFAQTKYGPVFDALVGDLPAIISSWSAPSSGTLSSTFAEYAVRRNVGGVNRVFLIYFVRGVDGVWRLDAM